ncbi:hypothetical protein M2317_003054 [Microbacterium sp. ZKA21]|uniref:hypothetical protein n=1 Tax=Microbacterium sp. ZKA21 TaxID=3381694 RepID=UPI003D20CD1C
MSDWPEAAPGDALFDIAVLALGHEERLDDLLVGYGTDVDRDVIRSWWSSSMSSGPGCSGRRFP